MKKLLIILILGLILLSGCKQIIEENSSNQTELDKGVEEEKNTSQVEDKVIEKVFDDREDKIIKEVFADYNLSPDIVVDLYDYTEDYGMEKGIAISLKYSGPNTLQSKYIEVGLLILVKVNPKAENYKIYMYNEKWNKVCEYKINDVDVRRFSEGWTFNDVGESYCWKRN